MRQLDLKLNELRKALGYTYEDVQAKLEERGIFVTPGTVGHWFNGIRKPRSLKHLQALCAVLETNLNALMGEDFTYAQNEKEQLLLNEFRLMTREQQAVYIALATTLAKDQKPEGESP